MQLHVTTVNSPLAFNKSFTASPLPDLWPGLWHSQISRLYLCITWPVRSLHTQGDAGSPWLANWGLRAFRCKLAMTAQHISLHWKNRHLRRCHNEKNKQPCLPLSHFTSSQGPHMIDLCGTSCGLKAWGVPLRLCCLLELARKHGSGSVCCLCKCVLPQKTPPPPYPPNTRQTSLLPVMTLAIQSHLHGCVGCCQGLLFVQC